DIFGNLLSRAEPTNRRYCHTDGLGSTVALTGETGSVAASMLYDAWGNVRVSTGTGHGKYRFTGAELDTTSNLYHMGARFYDPSIGRWLSEDPVQDRYYEPISLNYYAYVMNSPLALLDPDGSAGVTWEDLVRNPSALIEAALGLAVGYIGATETAGLRVLGSILIEMTQAAKKQAEGLARQVARHLADFVGRSDAGMDPRPGKDRRNTE